MPGRLNLSDIGSALSNLPGPAKWVGAALTVGPLLFALLGMGWAGWQTPSRLDHHIAQMDHHIAQMDSINQELTTRDLAMLRTLSEANRLSICNLKYQTYYERLRCAVPQ